jgi:signal transduction histidine kinase
MDSCTSLSDRLRTLHAQAILRIVLPLSLIVVGLIFAGTYAYNHIVTALIVERHRQLASLAAASVSGVIEGHVNVLETLASRYALLGQFQLENTSGLLAAEEVTQIFNAGVVIVDSQGEVIATTPHTMIASFEDKPGSPTLQSVREKMSLIISDVLSVEGIVAPVVLMAVPIKDAEDQFAGAVIAGMNLNSSALSKSVGKLTIGKDGFTYLVDRNGIVLAHPDPTQIGADYSDRTFTQEVAQGKSGAMLTKRSMGERLIEGYAPIEIAGWGLVMQESWDSVTEPIGLIAWLVIGVELVVIILVFILSWIGFERIAAPLRALHDQTEKLANGDSIEPIKESGIAEIDALERAFIRMAAQISAYRAGLHRYVGAITKSQEDERRRIARELHDDTIQSLLAVSRRLELYQSSESDPQRSEQIEELQDMLTGTLVGIRQINRDLRPLILEDLGLIPALKALVRAAQKGDGAVPHASMETSGRQVPLNPEQELAIYRITQEALTNIRKHAHATGVMVKLAFEAGIVRLQVVDDGRGFDVPSSLTDFTQQDRFGLVGIQERVWVVGGSLTIQSSPGQGTRLLVKIPTPELSSAGGTTIT